MNSFVEKIKEFNQLCISKGCLDTGVIVVTNPETIRALTECNNKEIDISKKDNEESYYVRVRIDDITFIYSTLLKDEAYSFI